MKNLRNLLTAVCILATTLQGCDYVTEPNITGGNTNENCVPDTFPPNTNTLRNVLLEELTGHECPNCPGASYDARQLQQTLAGAGKHLILVNLHAGSLADPHPAGSGSFETDFRCDASEEYHDHWLTPYVPLGMINRTEYNSAVLIDAADWSAAVNVEFAKPLEVNLQMQVKTDTATGELCIHNETEFLVSKTGTYNLIIYVVEDSIVDWQINGPNGDPTYPLNTNLSNYLHRHVLRGTVTPIWGTQVATGNITAGTKVINSYNYLLNPAWNKEHISLVAYIYDDSNEEILQVIDFEPEL